MLPCLMSLASWLMAMVAFFMRRKERISMVLMAAYRFLRHAELMLTKSRLKFLSFMTNRASSSKFWTGSSLFSAKMFLKDLDLYSWGIWVNSMLFIDFISCWVAAFWDERKLTRFSVLFEAEPFLVFTSSKKPDLSK